MSIDEEYALNCEMAWRIMREAKREPGRWPEGAYVGLVRGTVVDVSADVEEVFAAVRRVEPDRHRGMVFEIRDPDEVIYDLSEL
jgi:hypothetical protein